MSTNDVDMSKVNRLEVIDEDGRSYVNWHGKPLGIEMILQDGDRTIKVFTKGRSNVSAREEQGKVLTVQEIDALCDAYDNYVKNRYPDQWPELSAGFEAGVRAVADSGYLAPAKGSGWISVEDRLPEPKTLVLAWSWKQGYTVEWMVNDAGWDLDPPPTHWMPIPTVPAK